MKVIRVALKKSDLDRPLRFLRAELARQGIVLGIARARGPLRMMLDQSGVAEKIGSENPFHTVHAGAESFQRNGKAAAA